MIIDKMHIQIKPNGRYALVQNNKPPFEGDFYKIQKVADNSNYYCLWDKEEDEFFRLFNAEKKKYALGNTNSFEDAKLFIEVCNYSEASRSFVARRSDIPYSYIIYDDCTFESKAFKYVGEECNGMRPVMLIHDGQEKWLYYDSIKHRFLWPVEHGYTYKSGIRLGNWYNELFIVNLPKGHYDLCYYDKDKHKLCFIIRNCNGVPTYDKENKALIISKTGLFYIVIGINILSNYQWKENHFIIKGDYIFYKSSHKNGYQIFSIKNGAEIFYNWKNVRVCSENNQFYILADIDGVCQKKLTLKDLKQRWNELISRSEQNYMPANISALNSTSATDAEVDTSKCDLRTYTSIEDTKPLRNKTEIKSEQRKVQAFKCENELPATIEYCTSINNPKINREGILYSKRKLNKLGTDKYICWLNNDNKAVIVTKLQGNKALKVVFMKTYDADNALPSNLECIKKFIPINITDVTENTLLRKIQDALKAYAVLRVRKHAEPVCKPTPKASEDVTVQESSNTRTTLNDGITIFSFNDKQFKLHIGDVWEQQDAFLRRKYLLKNNIIAILLNPYNLVSIDHRKDVYPHYKIIGEGKDPRFDQELRLTNKAISDNSRKIVLFKKGEDGLLHFCDEVRCLNFSYVSSNKSKRKLILFDLVSTINKNTWYIE